MTAWWALAAPGHAPPAPPPPTGSPSSKGETGGDWRQPPWWGAPRARPCPVRAQGEGALMGRGVGAGQTPGGDAGSGSPSLPAHGCGAGAPRREVRTGTHRPFTQCAADMTKLGAMRVAPQKWPPRRCRDTMKGHACGRAARPPTISEARAGPENTGRGWSGEGHGGPCRAGAPHGPAAPARELRPGGRRGPATTRTSAQHSWTKTQRLRSPQGATSGSARLRAPRAASALRAGVLHCGRAPRPAATRQGRGAPRVQAGGAGRTDRPVAPLTTQQRGQQQGHEGRAGGAMAPGHGRAGLWRVCPRARPSRL